MKPTWRKWLWLLAVALVPWGRWETALTTASTRLMLWVGIGMVVVFVLSYLDLTYRGLRRSPPEQ